MLDADVPALSRKGALEALEWRLDSPRDMLPPRKQRADTSLEVNRMGHYVLGAVDFGKGPSRKVRGPVVSAPYFDWAATNKRPNLPNSGLQLPYAEAGPHFFGL